jgi:hypothetical protein
MAKNNRLWGAEHLRGALLKLSIPVCKRTIQKYMRQARLPRPEDQTWSTFLRNHAESMWAGDCLQVTDRFFRSLFAFFIPSLKEADSAQQRYGANAIACFAVSCPRFPSRTRRRGCVPA